jgi:flagellar basal body-associated protein FliL
MGDEDQDFLNDAVAGDDAGQKTRALPGFMIRVLRYAAIGAGIVIVAGTTAILVTRVSDTGLADLGLVSPQFQSKEEALSKFDLLDVIRGVTSDEQQQIFTLQVELGYEFNNVPIQTELNNRTSEIENLIFLHVSQKRAEELRPRNYTTLQDELKRQINNVLIAGRVDEVWLREFVVVQ